MKKSILLILLMLSIVAIAENTNGNNVGKEKQEAPYQKFCLFHGKVYEVIHFAIEECSFNVPGRSKTIDNGFGVPHDPACFSEFIRKRR